MHWDWASHFIAIYQCIGIRPHFIAIYQCIEIISQVLTILVPTLPLTRAVIEYYDVHVSHYLVPWYCNRYAVFIFGCQK